jgi:hypothetical protein
LPAHSPLVKGASGLEWVLKKPTTIVGKTDIPNNHLKYIDKIAGIVQMFVGG